MRGNSRRSRVARKRRQKAKQFKRRSVIAAAALKPYTKPPEAEATT